MNTRANSRVGPAGGVPPCSVRQPNGAHMRWLRAQQNRIDSMDMQSRINRVVLDAIMQEIDGEPVNISAILDGLDDAKTDISGVILTDAAIRQSAEEA